MTSEVEAKAKMSLIEQLDSCFMANNKLVIPQIKESVRQRPLKDATIKELIDEMYSIYEKCLIKENTLAKEIFFLELLQQLSDLLVIHDKPSVFVKRYLKCSIDSAGFDLTLCSLSRDFLTSVAHHDLRQANFIISEVIDTYVGKFAVGSIDLDKHSKDFEENERFVRSNCESLLIRIVNKIGISAFLRKMNETMSDATYRPLALDLLGSVLLKAEKSSKFISEIAKSNLLENLLNCLYFDESHVVLNQATTCLTIIIPYLLESYVANLSSFFMAYCRLVTLTLDFDEEMTPMAEKENPFELTRWDKAVKLDDEELIELNYFKLLVVLYGLTPLNLHLFLQSPKSRLDELDKNLINQVLYHDPRFDIFEIKNLTKHLLLERFKLHRNILEISDTGEELDRLKQQTTIEDLSTISFDYLIDQRCLESAVDETHQQSLELTQLIATHKELYTSRKKSVTSESSNTSLGFESSGNITEDSVRPAAYRPDSNVEFYKRELLLVRNDLNFAIYLKNLSESKLRKVLVEMQNQSKGHRMIESSMLSMKLLNNRHAVLTKNYEQLKEEHKKFKNERLKYEDLILSRSRALKKSKDDAQAEIKLLKLQNEGLADEMNELRKNFEKANLANITKNESQ